MTDKLSAAFAAIPVPEELEQQMLTACRAAARPAKPPLRVLPAVAVPAACALVLLVALLATKQLPGLIDGKGDLPTGEESAIPGGAPVNTTTATAVQVPGTTLSTGTVPTTPSPPASDHGFFEPAGDKTIVDRVFSGKFEEMTLEQLEAYYGRRALPQWVPADLSPENTPRPLGICHRDEDYIARMPEYWQSLVERGTVKDEEIVFDTNNFHFYGQGQRSLHIEVGKSPRTSLHLGDPNRFKETLTLQGITVKLAFYDDRPYVADGSYCHSAILTVEGVDYHLAGWDIPREEFLQIVESLL